MIPDPEWWSKLAASVVPAPAPWSSVESMLNLLTLENECLDLWLLEGEPAPPADRVALFRALKDTAAHLVEVAKLVEADVVPDLADPVEVDGVWFKAGRKRTAKGYDKDALRAKVSTLALTPIPDPETGEALDPPAAKVVDRMWTLCDVATGRTKVFRDVGVDLNEYAATVEWTDVIEEVK